MRKDHSPIAELAAGAGAFLLAAAITAAAATAEADVPAEARKVAEKMNHLGSDTLGRLTGKPGDTVIVSPYGLGSALHLLLLGAKGSADEALRGKLLPAGMSKQDEAVKALNGQILGAVNDKLKLTSSNAVFVPISAEPSDKFRKRTSDVLNARIDAVDFKGAGAIERINAWSKEATNGLVPRVLDELDANARFVLANAVYFSGAWETAFNPALTAKAPFTRADGSKQDAAMMDGVLTVDLAELDNLQAVWLPYHGRSIAMLVVAPGAEGGPTTVADALKKQSLDGLMAAAQKQARRAAVHVRLPRFRVESGRDITEALSSLIKPALAADSNYDAISKGRGDALQVVHRAVVEVTEAGSKAAAATAVTSDRSLAVTPVFAADRPFAFAIVHAPTQAILFAGYIADPGDGLATEAKNVR